MVVAGLGLLVNLLGLLLFGTASHPNPNPKPNPNPNPNPNRNPNPNPSPNSNPNPSPDSNPNPASPKASEYVVFDTNDDEPPGAASGFDPITHPFG